MTPVVGRGLPHQHARGHAEALLEAHRADLAIQADESVDFKQAWADPVTGHVFCLSEGPSKEAVQRIHQRAEHPYDEIHEIPGTA